MKTGTSILAGIFLIGVFSIPAASSNLETNEQTSIPQVTPSSSSEEASLGKEVEVNRTPSSVVREVTTAASQFVSRQRPDQEVKILETSDGQLEKTVSPRAETWTVTTPSGEMTVEKTPQKVVEEVSTPSGELRLVREDGRVSEDFSGANRDAVEATASDLRDTMTDFQDRMQERAGTETLSVNLSVNPDGSYTEGSSEGVTISNTGEAVDLSQYRLKNNNPDYFELPDQELGSGENVTVYSADEVDSGGTSDIYGADLSWEEGGDTATLVDEEGREVASTSY